MSREKEVRKYGDYAFVLNPELRIQDPSTGLVGIAFGMVNLGAMEGMINAGEPQMYYIAEWPNGRYGAHEKSVRVIGPK